MPEKKFGSRNFEWLIAHTEPIECIYIPICIGGNSTLTGSELKNIYDFFRQFKQGNKPVKFEFRLEINDKHAYQKWLKENTEVFKQLEDAKQVKISDSPTDTWRDEEWTKLKAVYVEFIRKRDLQSLLDQDIAKIQKNHPDWAREDIEEHIINVAVDLLRWHPKDNTELKNNKAPINVVFYPHAFLQIMRHALQVAPKIQIENDTVLRGEGLVHLKAEYSAVSKYLKFDSLPMKMNEAEFEVEIVKDVELESQRAREIFEKQLNYIVGIYNYSAQRESKEEAGEKVANIITRLSLFSHKSSPNCVIPHSPPSHISIPPSSSHSPTLYGSPNGSPPSSHSPTSKSPPRPGSTSSSR